MMKFNGIQFAAGLSADLRDEMNDLDNMITACREGDGDVDELVKTYRHLSSFLQGVDYMLDYMEDGDAKDEMQELLKEQWLGDLRSNWADVAAIKWSRELGEEVTISTTYLSDRRRLYTVKVGEHVLEDADDTGDVIDWLKGLRK
jgi:hypothetical protein